MLECKKICKIYKIGSKAINALNNVSFKLNDGEFVSIIGGSGSGKSTLMNILGCLDSFDGGEYFIDGKNVSKFSDKALCRVRAEKIGFVFQNFSLIPTLTAFENIELPLIYRGICLEKRHDAVLTALEAVGMLSRSRHLPSQLSGGQMQRVAVARAVAGNPSVILADEPTGNLDRNNTADVLSILTEFNKVGKSIVLVTHDLSVAKAAERTIKITDGRIDYA